MSSLTDKIAEVQARLDRSTSDPKWLNDSMAEIALLAAQTPENVEPNEYQQAWLDAFTGDGVGAATFSDVCAAAALQGMLTRWKGADLHAAGAITQQQAAGTLYRLCQWANIAGVQMQKAKDAMEAAIAAGQEAPEVKQRTEGDPDALD